MKISPDRRLPYNFVPYSDHVVIPEWWRNVSHDHPFEDGICGRLEVELEARTPLFIGGQGERSYRDPEENWAIPGSSLRGMLRNVVEIATFSALDRVNDHRFGVRDLNGHPDLYRKHMATAVPDQGLIPLVNAGWMRKTDDPDHPAKIVPCSYAKVEYGLLQELAGGGFEPGRRQSARKKYLSWGSRPLECSLDVEHGPRQVGEDAPVLLGTYGQVRGTRGRIPGKLVFTGQPQEWKPGSRNKKHHDFFFFNPENRAIPVSRSVFQDFRFVHRGTGEQHRMKDNPNEEWGYWKRQAFDKGKEVPVFFLLEPGCKATEPRLRAIGLAQMFRLAYLHTVKEGIRQQRDDPTRDDPTRDDPTRDDPTSDSTDAERSFDLAECMFGVVPLEQDPKERSVEHPGLKGRVSVGLARAQDKPKIEELGPVEGVLGSPKATYYPAYVEQGTDAPGQRPPKDGKWYRYRTYMDDEYRIRGWKRYVQRKAPIPLPEAPTKKVAVKFHPLGAGARFRFAIRVHNLRPVELGALLWALDFGGAEGARHSLGMARSAGYGGVTLRLDLEKCDVRDVRMKRLAEGWCARCVEAFQQYMEDRLSAVGEPDGWSKSRSITELVALARPVDDGDRYRHFDLKKKEFSKAKADDGWALPAHSDRDAERGGPPAAPSDPPRRSRARGRDASRTPRTSGAGGSTSPAQSDAPATPDEREREEMERAIPLGRQYDLCRKWMKEAGDRLEARHAIARTTMKRISKKARTRHPDVITWLEHPPQEKT